MYAIVYTQTALKDIPKLKAAHLDDKAKELIAVIRENPYQIPPPYEKLVGDLQGLLLYICPLVHGSQPSAWDISLPKL